MIQILLLVLLLLLALCTIATGTGHPGDTCPMEVCTKNRRRIVSFGSNSDVNYLFYLPLTAKMWEKRGYEPMVLLALPTHPVDKKQQDLVKLAEDFAVEWTGAVVTHAPTNSELAVAMIGRMLAACERTLHPEDEIILSDIDMWVLNDELWSKKNASARLHYYGFMMDDPSPTYFDKHGPQMCHVEASVAVWRDMMHLPPDGCEWGDALHQLLVKWASQHPEHVWETDQLILAARVREWRSANGEDVDAHRQTIWDHPHLQMDGRFRSWNREAYPADHDFGQYQSAHVPRPGFPIDRWEVTRQLLALYLNPAEMEQAEGYRDRFLAVLETSPVKW